MKKYFSAMAVVAIAALPLAAHASLFHVGQDYATSPTDHLAGNIYAAGGTVSIGSSVDGDLIVAGGSISVSGRVGGDIAAAGGTIQILGPVSGDVRMLGGQITINQRVEGDVIVGGGSLHILPGGWVDGSLYAAGGQIVIDGTVSGLVRTAGGKLTINGTVGDVSARVDRDLVVGPSAVIRGGLSYSASHEASIADGARISGAVDYRARVGGGEHRAAPAHALFVVLGIITAMRMVMFLGAVALIMWLWRRPTLGLLQSTRDAFWPRVGRGAVVGFLAPIAAVLLIVSFVGTLAGGILLALYVSVLIIAKVLTGVFLGAWLAGVIGKQSTLRLSWTSAIAGTVLMQLLTLIPIIGWIALTLIFLAVLGECALRIQQRILQRSN